MAREIIILGVTKGPDGSTRVTGVFWLTAPPSVVRPLANASSAVPSVTGGPTWGLTGAELASIQSGAVVEQFFDSGQIASTFSSVQIQTGLQTAYANAQTALNNLAPASHWIGASWDGASWAPAP